MRAAARHRRRPLLGLSHHRWSRVLVSGTARKAKERAVLGSRDHPFRAPDGGPARARDRDRASEPPSRLVAAPPEKPEIAEAAEWRTTAADQLLAFTCCWPELKEPARPPAWPLALLPLGFYPLWWIAKPRRGLRAVRTGDAGRVAARRRLHRHNGRDSIRERREVSAIGVVRERRSASRDDEQLSSRRRCSTGLDESATSLFVLSINEQQHVSLASLVDAADPMARPSVRSRLVTG